MRTRTVDNNILIPAIDKILREGHTVTLTVKGRSMNPAVSHGRDKALIAAVDEVKLGDALLVKTDDGRYVLHRLIRIDGDKLTLKGDGNLRGIETCTRANVIGRAAMFIRPSGRKVSTTGTAWKVYSWVWMHTGYWFHRGVLGVYHRILKRT